MLRTTGDIVGNYTDADGPGHGFLLRKRVFSTIAFPGTLFTAARSVNARGDVAGRFLDADGIGFLLRDGHFTQAPPAIGTQLTRRSGEDSGGSMWRAVGIALVIALTVAVSGCGGESSSPRGSSSLEASISISPSSATVGSPDLMLTITGSNFLGAHHNFSQAVWSSNGSQTFLATTFVSSTRLTAIVPSNLLISPVSAQVFVQTGDPMGDLPLQKSGSAGFSGTALPVGRASISSILPESVTAGSSDITVIITGSNFDFERLRMSIAFWSTSPTGTHCCDKWLQTTFVSSTQLTAVIPAALLQNPVTAYVYVETGDPMGMSDGVSYPRSNSVTFKVGP